MPRLRVTRYYIPAGSSFDRAVKRCQRDALEHGPVTIIRGDGLQCVLSATLHTVDIVRSARGGDLYALQYEAGFPHTPAHLQRWTGPLTIARAMETFDLQWIEQPMAMPVPLRLLEDGQLVTMPPATRTIEVGTAAPVALDNLRRLK
ncbi:MAG TPA: hypothetical protein VGS80_22200 [Ktedonobacterales bacterium]|nr:hypothetical protein [Ktedonobacterales bacterium]